MNTLASQVGLQYLQSPLTAMGVILRTVCVILAINYQILQGWEYTSQM